jgi:hypothetical protein
MNGSDSDTKYPDISDILARKAAGRRQRAAFSSAEKLDILDAMRERVAPIGEARERRKAQRAQGEPAAPERSSKRS